MNYSAYGLTLSSTLPLPELPMSAAGASVAITRRSRPLSETGWDWLLPLPRRKRGNWIAVALRGGLYRVVFNGGVEFLIDRRGSTITALLPASTSLPAVRNRLLDQVVPLAMSQRGRIVLHASALLTTHGAVAFAGPAGAGKSTLASSFALAGMALLADDALVVKRAASQWLATPAYPGVRLFADAESMLSGAASQAFRVGAEARKRRLARADGVRFTRNSAPLRRVYIIEHRDTPRGAVRIEALSPRDSMMALVEYAFVLDIKDRRRMTAHFGRLAAAAAGIDVRRLSYPRKSSALPRVREAVLADVSSR